MNTSGTIRLTETVDDLDCEAYQRGRRDGMAWAHEFATLDELRGFVDNFEPGRSADVDGDHSLRKFINGKQHKDASSVPHYDNPFWRGFASGAEEVLDELSPPS